MKNSKKVSISVLILLALLLTGYTWSYWNAGTIKPHLTENGENTVVLGAAKNQEVETTLTIAPGSTTKPLIPANIYNKLSDGERSTFSSEAALTINATWTENQIGKEIASGAQGTIKAEILGVSIDGIDVNHTDNKIATSLIKPTFDKTMPTITLNDSTATPIGLSVTMNEPKNKSEYEAIANKTIKVKVRLSVTPL